MTDSSLISTFALPCRALVVGGSGGIGRALIETLIDDPLIESLHDWSRRNANASGCSVKWTAVDITDEESIRSAASELAGVDLVIVATGLLCGADGRAPEKSWRELSAEQMTENFMINTVGPALRAKHLLPLRA